MVGLGLDVPSGGYLKFNEGGNADIGVLRATDKVATAKPRFAVAMDYADVLGPGLFEHFESRSDNGPFEIRINPELKLPGEARIIQGMVLTVLQGRVFTHYPMELTFEAPGKYVAKYPPALLADLKCTERKPGSKSGLVFLTAHFTNTLATRLAFAHYNFASPWTYQVELKSRADDMNEKAASEPGELSGVGTFVRSFGEKGYLLRRAPGQGEVPNHDYYKRNFPQEYGYDQADADKTMQKRRNETE